MNERECVCVLMVEKEKRCVKRKPILQGFVVRGTCDEGKM